MESFSPESARKGGLYLPRLWSHNTGNTLARYSEIREALPDLNNVIANIEACLTPLPIDRHEVQEPLNHQTRLFGELSYNAMKDLNNVELATQVMDIVSSRIFQYASDFNLAIAGTHDSGSYIDPSFNVLLVFYKFLAFAADIATPCTFYDYLDRPEYIIKVFFLINAFGLIFLVELFELLISPDRRERIMITSIINSLLTTHPHHRNTVMEHVGKLLRFIEETEMDHVPARMVVPLIDIYEK